jgi:hypothetical protein
MIWILASSVLVAAAFIATFLTTGNTWDAAIAGGIVSLVFVIGFLYRITRPPTSSRQRRWTIGIGSIVILGMMFHWTVMYRMTNWQYDTLHLIHKIIVHGIAQSLLQPKGVNTLSEYAGQQGSKSKSLGTVFRETTQFDLRDSLVALNKEFERTRMFVASLSDSDVVLVVQDSLTIDGEDPHFKNFDGRYGMVQDRLRITKRGLEYEIQN